MDSVHGLSKLELWVATAFVLDIEKREKDICIETASRLKALASLAVRTFKSNHIKRSNFYSKLEPLFNEIFLTNMSARTMHTC